jgi:hypothetical protein
MQQKRLARALGSIVESTNDEQRTWLSHQSLGNTQGDIGKLVSSPHAVR